MYYYYYYYSFSFVFFVFVSIVSLYYMLKLRLFFFLYLICNRCSFCSLIINIINKKNLDFIFICINFFLI